MKTNSGKIPLTRIDQYTNENTWHIGRLETAQKAPHGYFLSYTIVDEGILTLSEAKARAKRIEDQLIKELKGN